MTQADLGTANPLDADNDGAARAQSERPRRRELPGFAYDLLGSAGRIALYAVATVAIGLITLVLALLASGVLAV